LRRKLWLLDILLFALVIFSASMLRQRMLESRVREEALLKIRVPVAPPPALAPVGTVTPASSASYMEVAQLLLFSKDRNSSIILDPPAPPPPPKPMPSLPISYGVMDLGEGPTVILAEKAGAQHSGYRPGEKIGEFKLVALNNTEIVLEWEGKYVKRRIEELADRQPIQLTPAAGAEAAPAAATAPATSLSGKKEGPGADMGNQTKACVPGDQTAAGVVQDGFKKVLTKTPFGESCRWEPVQ
jgi:hypothetical protein